MSQSTSSDARLPEALYEVILDVLQQHTDGIKEYDLLQVLRSNGYFIASADSPVTPHGIFQTHFLLYHALYLLREQLLSRKQGYLQIEIVNIQLLPYQQGNETLTQYDKLMEYYLDLDNLENTTEEDVDSLIASFWNNLARYEQRDDALAVLGLADPVDDSTIKKTYRRLAMQHHPDRGGDKQQLQAINAAIELLLK